MCMRQRYFDKHIWIKSCLDKYLGLYSVIEEYESKCSSERYLIQNRYSETPFILATYFWISDLMETLRK